MKKLSRLTAALVAALVFSVFLGCASKAPKVAASQKGQPAVMLTHSGAAVGLTEFPGWVGAYVMGGNNDLAVEKLPDYAKQYCFVGTAQGPNRDFVQTWANTVAGPQAVGATLNTRIEGVLDATRKGNAAETDTERAMTQSLVNNISATFSGVRPVANYWVQWRTYDPDVKNKVMNEDYTAYTLYVADKKTFDNQMAQIIAQTIATHKELSAQERSLYSDLIKRIQERGLDL